MTDTPATPETKKEPFQKALSDKVKLLFGYKDAHAELRVKPPKLPVIPVKIAADKIETIKKAFDEGFSFAMKSEEERKKGPEVERILDDRCKVKLGFPDGHIQLFVRPMKVAPWLPLTVDRDELLRGKPAMDEVFAWSQLPEDLRKMQGCD